MLAEPLSPTDAKKVILRILASGTVSFWQPHATDEMKKDSITTNDVLSVLRGGVVEPAEERNGTWRYRVRTSSIYCVVRFLSESHLIVWTAWRVKK